MTRLLMLASLSLMTILMFAAAALAQEYDRGQPAVTGAETGAEAGRGQPRVVTSAEATGAAVDGGTATASPTAMATASPTSTATASPTASPTATVTVTGLARTGGPAPVLPITLMASLMLIGSGVAALVLLRRSFHAEE